MTGSDADLTRKLDEQSKNEFGEIAHYFNILSEQFRTTVQDFAGQAQNVASGSTELSATADQMQLTTAEIARGPEIHEILSGRSAECRSGSLPIREILDQLEQRGLPASRDSLVSALTKVIAPAGPVVRVAPNTFTVKGRHPGRGRWRLHQPHFDPGTTREDGIHWPGAQGHQTVFAGPGEGPGFEPCPSAVEVSSCDISMP
jgi:hypothetical protein